MKQNPDNIEELARLAGEFKAAFDMGMLALSDGGNVQGAIGALVGTQDMLIDKALEIHESRQIDDVELPLHVLLQTDHCQLLINGAPIQSAEEAEDGLLLIHTDEGNPFWINAQTLVKLPTPPEGQVVSEDCAVFFNLMRPLHPRDFHEGKVRVYGE